MCFSASASFAASAILASAGVASIRKAADSSQVPFAAIALIFSAQQFCEGFLWIGLTSATSEAWRQIPTHMFLFAALLSGVIFFVLIGQPRQPATEMSLKV